MFWIFFLGFWDQCGRELWCYSENITCDFWKVHKRSYFCLCVFVCLCVYVYVYVCMYVCMYVSALQNFYIITVLHSTIPYLSLIVILSHCYFILHCYRLRHTTPIHSIPLESTSLNSILFNSIQFYIILFCYTIFWPYQVCFQAMKACT